MDMTVLLEEYVETASEHLDQVEAALMKLEECAGQGVADDGHLTHLLGNLHTLKGNSGMMGFTPLLQFIHKLETVLKEVTGDSGTIDPSFFEALYSTVNVLRDALRTLSDNPAAPLNFDDHLMLLECLTAKDAGGWDIPLPAMKRDDFATIIQKSGVLKVNFEKLDELMNLVGELVIHRTTLVSLEARLQETVKDRELVEAYRESGQMIGKIATDLREAVMKVRMLPVKTVFHRFNRLVRDLSRRHGKEIALVFDGEDTELDKTVIDEISEPLLHLIRNAVDHGIEKPLERTRSGKRGTGVLKLTAAHQGNDIVITVQDDGRGMSVAKLKESAVVKGLITPHDAGSMSDHDAFDLVFTPGFSTSAEVTETSGRGIGLDVVKKTVAGLNGGIHIESTPGKGTCFTIKLPLTLAIITALMVEVSGETFAIPLSAVEESICTDAAELHDISTAEVINLRDRLLPVIRLDRYFSLERRNMRETEYMVVVGSGGKRAGIVVDRLVGQQEVVIKRMDDYLGDLPGISGGTVLGDGRISLILDVAALIGERRTA